VEYDEVAAKQTALAQELTELYPPFEATPPAAHREGRQPGEPEIYGARAS